jgi:hypothetical protein
LARHTLAKAVITIAATTTRAFDWTAFPIGTGTISRRTSSAPNAGTIGYVDTRLDWSEVINFNKGIG